MGNQHWLLQARHPCGRAEVLKWWGSPGHPRITWGADTHPWVWWHAPDSDTERLWGSMGMGIAIKPTHRYPPSEKSFHDCSVLHFGSEASFFRKAC